jgi:hypothetical protein
MEQFIACPGRGVEAGVDTPKKPFLWKTRSKSIR